MKSKQRHLSVAMGLFAAASAISLTGCEQNYGLTANSTGTVKSATNTSTTVSPTGVSNPVAPVVSATATPSQPVKPPVITPTATPSPVVPANSALTTESFNAASNQIKKIDFLFVIDNSGSMSDNQKKLARGFKAFANTFYRRADLDICTMIITSDRYLGKEGYKGYERERTLPCTKPSGSEKWSPAQVEAHIDALIEEFQSKVYVGTYGNGVELLGKSLVSFLYGLDQWGDRTDVSRKSTFFRKDAVANISFVSDENNYFFEDLSETDESANDLPFVTNTAIPAAKNGEIDTRKGIKEYADEYFGALNPGKALSYSMTSIIELTQPADTIPGISVNLNQLTSAVGRESKQSDISGDVDSYTNVYQSIADAIVLRAGAFNLAHAVIGDLQVSIRHSSGEVAILPGTDYTLQNQNLITLNPRVLSTLQSGDRVDVSYRYALK